MSLYEKNLLCLQKNFRYIYEHLKLRDEIEEKITVETYPAKDGTNIDKVILDNGKEFRMNSAYAPLKEAERWASQFKFNNIGIVISVFGIGNGYFIRELIKRMESDCQVIIFEPSLKLFYHIMEHYDLTDILGNEKITLIIKEINGADLPHQLDQKIEFVNLNSQIRCCLPQYDELFTEDYKEYLEALRDNDISALTNRNTTALLGKAMADNTIYNLKYLFQSNNLVEYQNDFPKDIPVIIVSAGPSLDKNINDLKAAQGKAIIVAVDSALKYLLKINLIPDFVVTIDARKSMSHFESEEFKTIPLLCMMSSNNEVLKEHKGRKIFFELEKYTSELYKYFEKPWFSYVAGGSVATAAYSIFVCMGFRTIILIGQDLAYKDGATHAGGINRNVRNMNALRGIAVESIDGEQIETRGDWLGYLQWFENAIAANPTVLTIDATEGGAKIKGSQIMTLKDAVSRFCLKEIDCAGIIEKKGYTFSEEEFTKLYDYLKNSVEELNNIYEQSKKAAFISEKLILAAKQRNLGSKKNQERLEKIGKYNQEIIDTPVYSLIDYYIADVAGEELVHIFQLTDDEVENQVKTYKMAKIIYKTTAEAARDLYPKMKDEILKIGVRHEEDNANGNFSSNSGQERIKKCTT